MWDLAVENVMAPDVTAALLESHEEVKAQRAASGGDATEAAAEDAQITAIIKATQALLDSGAPLDDDGPLTINVGGGVGRGAYISIQRAEADLVLADDAPVGNAGDGVDLRTGPGPEFATIEDKIRAMVVDTLDERDDDTLLAIGQREGAFAVWPEGGRETALLLIRTFREPEPAGG